MQEGVKKLDANQYTQALAFAYSVLSDNKISNRFSMTRYGKLGGPYVYLDDAREAVRQAWELSQIPPTPTNDEISRADAREDANEKD